MITINLKNLPCHIDNRGQIQMVLESCQIGSISRIISNPNTWRARHWHPKDFHFCEVIEGQIEYYDRIVTDVNNNDIVQKPNKIIVNKGNIVYTPPGYFHEMVFPCYTIFNCYSHLPRIQESYEKETIKYLDLSLKDIYNNWKD